MTTAWKCKFCCDQCLKENAVCPESMRGGILLHCVLVDGCKRIPGN